jgi:hypothetical protein
MEGAHRVGCTHPTQAKCPKAKACIHPRLGKGEA